MNNKTYTIIVVTKGQRAPYSVKISRKAIKRAAALFVTAFFCLVLLVGSYASLVDRSVRLSHVEKENAVYRADMKRLENDFNLLLGQVEDLEILGKEVREIVSGEQDSEVRDVASRSSSRLTETFEDSMQLLLEALPEKTREMNELLSEAEDYKIKMEHTPNIWPVEGRITSQFGWRKSPFSMRQQYHTGIDIGAKSGTIIVASASGTVREARYRYGWGNVIVVNHGVYNTFYAHLRRIHVKVGDQVEKGQKIGEVGSTGFSTGPHLHFEIHENGIAIDPMKILKKEVPVGGL